MQTPSPHPDDRWADPFRASLLAEPDHLPQRLVQCGPGPTGEPAFDPAEIWHAADNLALPKLALLNAPLLERSVRIGLAHIDATFIGDHPKYGTGTYRDDIHDGFPPTIIAAVDALTLWGFSDRAQSLLGYWLDRFVRADGTIDYYGPSLSEYGQLLTTGRRLMDRGGQRAWVKRHAAALNRLAAHLRSLIHASGRIDLVPGVPEADENDRPATYFHNNAWVVRGFRDWSVVLDGMSDGESMSRLLKDEAAQLETALLGAIEDVWPADPDDWWLRPTVEQAHELIDRSQPVTVTRLGSYTNYRYWPELLSSGVLPRRWMRRIVESRLRSGGQWCGCTRFMARLDDWPLMEYLDGLWALEELPDYLLSLWGHVHFHLAQEHLTAYEQVSLPPGTKCADYCLPCQLVAARAARRLIGGTGDGSS